MKQAWMPKKADAARVRRARKAKALRAERRGKAVIEHEAACRADEGVEVMKREIGAAQARQSLSGKRQ